MAVARLAADASGDLVVGLYEVRHPSGDDRVDAFDEVSGGVHTVAPDRVLPGVVLGPAEQVAGIREGRLVLAGLGVAIGVPTDVVEVEVGAHHRIDVMPTDA